MLNTKTIGLAEEKCGHCGTKIEEKVVASFITSAERWLKCVLLGITLRNVRNFPKAPKLHCVKCKTQLSFFLTLQRSTS